MARTWTTWWSPTSSLCPAISTRATTKHTRSCANSIRNIASCHSPPKHYLITEHPFARSPCHSPGSAADAHSEKEFLGQPKNDQYPTRHPSGRPRACVHVAAVDHLHQRRHAVCTRIAGRDK